MSKKEKNAPQEEQEKNTCPDQPQEVTEEYRQEEPAEETYTVTREQMENGSVVETLPSEEQTS